MQIFGITHENVYIWWMVFEKLPQITRKYMILSIRNSQKARKFEEIIQKGVISIPNWKNKGSCLYQIEKIRGHCYTERVKNHTHRNGTSVLTRIMGEPPPPPSAYVFGIKKNPKWLTYGHFFVQIFFHFSCHKSLNIP